MAGHRSDGTVNLASTSLTHPILLGITPYPHDLIPISSVVGTPLSQHRVIPNITVSGVDSPTDSPSSYRRQPFVAKPSSLVIDSSVRSLENQEKVCE